LMDYVDFVVHIFLTEKRAYYDIERLRKSARTVDQKQLKAMLVEKTVVARAKPAKKAAKKAVAKKTATKPAPKADVVRRKPASRKTDKS
jgi:ribosome-associated protein